MCLLVIGVHVILEQQEFYKNKRRLGVAYFLLTRVKLSVLLLQDNIK